MQGPPRRELLPLLRGFEQKLRFPSVLVSLSRSEPKRGQEQSARPPFNLPVPAGRSQRRGPGEGRAGQLHSLAPGEAGTGPQAQLLSCPWGPLAGGDHCGCPGGSVPFQSAWPSWPPDQPSGGQLRFSREPEIPSWKDAITKHPFPQQLCQRRLDEKSRPSPQPVSNKAVQFQRRMTKAEHLTSVQSRDIIPQNVQENFKILHYTKKQGHLN